MTELDPVAVAREAVAAYYKTDPYNAAIDALSFPDNFATIGARAMQRAMSEINADHLSLLRGIIAEPTWTQIEHLYPEALALRDEVERLREALTALAKGGVHDR